MTIGGYTQKRPKTLAEGIWKMGLQSKKAKNACNPRPKTPSTLEKDRKLVRGCLEVDY